MRQSNELNKIDPNTGVGIKFNNTYAESGEEAITLERTEYELLIGVEISTWVGISVDAQHFYASFHVPGVMCCRLSDPDRKFSTNLQPKESQGYTIEVVVAAKKDIYSFYMGDDRLVVKKGCPTHQFEIIEDCIEAVEQEFKRIFGPPWKLVQRSTDREWAEYKEELLKSWSAIR